MKKKILIALSYVLVIALTLAATVAYFTDTDSAVNVMSVGNIAIEQIEQERDENGNLVAFKQAKNLMPAHFEGSSINWAPEAEWVVANDQAWKVVADNSNVIDKFVTVKNTGDNDAFVRTIIAYEGNLEYGPEGAYIHVVHNGNNVDPAIDIECVGVANIDGVDYTVYVYTYSGALASGDTSDPSLKQIYMNKNTTQEIAAKYGDTYDVLVLSQAVQADMGVEMSAEAALNAAFGEITVDNNPWVATDAEGNRTENAPEVPAVVGEVEELTEALAEGEDVVLTADIEIAEELELKEDAEINLNGHSLTVTEIKATDSDADIIISGGTLVHGENDFPAVSVSAGTLKMEEVTVVCNEYCNLYTSGSLEAAEYVGIQVWGGKVELNNCNIIAKADKVRAINSVYGIGIHGGELIINGGSITVENPGSTMKNYEAAISAGTSSSEVTLNNVALNLGPNAEYLHLFKGGSIIINTTAAEGSVTDSMIKTFDGAGTYSINYID